MHLDTHPVRMQDLKREFVTELIFPAVQANAIYEVNLQFILHYRVLSFTMPRLRA